jgi:MoxR-like ATPase
MNDLLNSLQSLVDNVSRVVVGKDETIRLIIASMLSRGHVLLEDKPGVGKTMMARALARSVDCQFKRIQCTPDLLPVDVTGYFDPRTREFRPGPVFTNILLADELNRATPRTQSALLEAMGEGQVTVEGETYLLPDPFIVIATQNPVEHRGVNDLPEAQLDRFQVLLTPGYPSESEEKKILINRQSRDPFLDLSPVMDVVRLRELMAVVPKITMSESLIDYVIKLVRNTRQSPLLHVGASPRCALQLMQLCRAHALVENRSFVVPDDVKTLAGHVLPHRVLPNTSSSETMNTTEWKQEIVRRIIEETRPPAA